MKKNSLWLLGLSPLIWSFHFLATYITVALWCAKPSLLDLSGVRFLISIYTIASFIIVGWGILSGFFKHKKGQGILPHDDDTLEDRERFLGFTRFLISSLSLVAIIYTTYAVWVFRSCE